MASSHHLPIAATSLFEMCGLYGRTPYSITQSWVYMSLASRRKFSRSSSHLKYKQRVSAFPFPLQSPSLLNPNHSRFNSTTIKMLARFQIIFSLLALFMSGGKSYTPTLFVKTFLTSHQLSPIQTQPVSRLPPLSLQHLSQPVPDPATSQPSTQLSSLHLRPQLLQQALHPLSPQTLRAPTLDI